tara:strand:- start:436 stop:1098 length:663 start_codon:yes stop_codon:yes gene_type:complete
MVNNATKPGPEKSMTKVGRPTKADIRQRPENRCTAMSKTTREQCGKSAGWGTDHKGEGNCKLHGGATPSSLATSIVTDDIDLLVEHYMADPNMFDLRKDLATLRALRDTTMEEIRSTNPNSDERDRAVYKLSGIISNIVRSSERFFELLNKQNFALTVAQARQIRENMKRILFEEVGRLMTILAPFDKDTTINNDLDEWRMNIARRLETELTIESEVNKS